MNEYASIVMLVLVSVVVVICLIGIASVLEDVCTNCEGDSEDDEAEFHQKIPVSNKKNVRERNSYQCTRRAREFSPVSTRGN
jgi:hypothetical protein